LTTDKIFMKSWFDRHHDEIIVIDEQIQHITNSRHKTMICDKEVKILVNYIISDSNSTTVSPYIRFYDNDTHRVSLVTSLMFVDHKHVDIGEYTVYADDEENSITDHGYRNHQGEHHGVMTELQTDGKLFEKLYDHNTLVNPIKIYYNSGNLSGYYDDGDNVEVDGNYSYYNDDSGNTLSREVDYKDAILKVVRWYNRGKLYAVMFHTNSGVLDHVDIYYESGHVKQHIYPTYPGQVGINEVVLDDLLAGYDLKVIFYYDNVRHKRESSGRLLNGVKVGNWHYYSDNAKNTIKTTIRH